MRIDIITVLPEMLEGFFNCSIMSRAQKKGIAEIHIHNLRDYAYDRYRKVDDYPFGGFAGMVMKIEPIDRCISALKAEREYDEIIFTSPDGEQFNQPMANSLSFAKNLIIICGHFKGIDYRIREHFITKEISIGDYVLTGGELAAAVIADAVVRIIPGVISDEQSALSDSFQDNLLAAPVYTRPAEYKGWQVPDVLLSGHEAKIKEWELQQSLERTQRLSIPGRVRTCSMSLRWRMLSSVYSTALLLSTGINSFSSIAVLFYLFDERTAALMLLSLKVIPLCLNFSVQLQFGVAFRKDKT